MLPVSFTIPQGTVSTASPRDDEARLFSITSVRHTRQQQVEDKGDSARVWAGKGDAFEAQQTETTRAAESRGPEEKHRSKEREREREREKEKEGKWWSARTRTGRREKWKS